MNLRSLTVAALGLALGCATTQAAKVSKTDAERIALTRAPGGTVRESELEKEHGKLAWSFDIATPGTNAIAEVQVDATTGQVISVEEETPEQQRTEQKQDEKK
jgi:uncharacterized membrane protein YkoI